MHQLAQQKFEAQEEKLRDVVRHSMSLLRDYSSLSEAECTRRVADVRRAMLRYEMQIVRINELQERRRRQEVSLLDKETEGYVAEADAEAQRTVELRAELENEVRRRKRYEAYERQAEEVCKKRSRTEAQASIDAVNSDISRLKEQRSELEATIEQRNQRAQLLRHAAAELTADLAVEMKKEKEAMAVVA